MFTLPEDYPSSAPAEPEISCVWLTIAQLDKLKKHLVDLAQEYLGTVVLFLWINLIQQESLELLGLSKEINLYDVRYDRSKIFRPR